MIKLLDKRHKNWTQKGTREEGSHTTQHGNIWDLLILAYQLKALLHTIMYLAVIIVLLLYCDKTPVQTTQIN